MCAGTSRGLEEGVRMGVGTRYGLFIDNREIPAGTGDERESVDPATGAVWAVAAEGGEADIDAAVAAARAGLHGPWAQTLPRERGRLLRGLAELIERESERLVAAEIRDNGKTVREVTAQYRLVAEFYRY